MDNFIAWLGVVFKYSCKIVAYLGGFGVLLFLVVIGVVGMWGFLACVWEEIKMEVHKDESK